MAAGQMLIALDFHLGPVQEFAVVGERDSAEMRQVLRSIWSGFRPNKVVALQDGSASNLAALLKDRPAQGAVTTYICENFTCQAPLVGAEAVTAALKAV